MLAQDREGTFLARGMLAQDREGLTASYASYGQGSGLIQDASRTKLCGLALVLATASILFSLSISGSGPFPTSAIGTARDTTGAQRYDENLSEILNCHGESFRECWNFFKDHDPTQGYVKYLPYDQAVEAGIYQVDGVKGKGIYMGADTGKKKPVQSIRVESKLTFTTGFFLIDIAHIPTGPGVWPAWWSYGPNWPNSGEIDTIESVSGSNTYTTLHSGPECEVDPPGISQGGNCNGGGGCGVTGGANGPGIVPDGAAGDQFNKLGGGVYATLWSENAIQMWMWHRADIPDDIRHGKPNISNWTAPYVTFRIGSGTNCTGDHFANHRLVINLDFCGMWCGDTFPGAGGQEPGRDGCEHYVSDPDSNLSEAYWLINYVKAFRSAESTLLPWGSSSSCRRPCLAFWLHAGILVVLAVRICGSSVPALGLGHF